MTREVQGPCTDRPGAVAETAMTADLEAQLVDLDPWVHLVRSAPADLGHRIDGAVGSTAQRMLFREGCAPS